MGLFALVEVALRLGLADLLARLIPAGTGPDALSASSPPAPWASNAVDNLPAYLALSATTDDNATRLVALLIGTNLAVLVTPWASLANLLWHERCRRAGVRGQLGQLRLARSDRRRRGDVRGHGRPAGDRVIPVRRRRSAA